MWSEEAHLALSIFLHVTGVLCGVFIWYLFPKNPRNPQLKRSQTNHSSSTNTTTEEASLTTGTEPSQTNLTTAVDDAKNDEVVESLSIADADSEREKLGSNHGSRSSSISSFDNAELGSNTDSDVPDTTSDCRHSQHQSLASSFASSAFNAHDEPLLVHRKLKHSYL